jgi:hypothetical protein
MDQAERPPRRGGRRSAQVDAITRAALAASGPHSDPWRAGVASSLQLLAPAPRGLGFNFEPAHALILMKASTPK